MHESINEPPQGGLFDGLHADIGNYYSQKVKMHGATPLGVDWPCVPTQELRFVQLLRICDFSGPFSLNDLGCGYGALLKFLARRHRGTAVDYLGVDLSPAMLAEASRLWKKRPGTQFMIGHASDRLTDYSLASGIFNVKLHQPRDLWTRFIEETLTTMHTSSRIGFAVNFLSPLPEGVQGVSELYRAPADRWASFCEQRLGTRVERLENYGLKEYTLLVRRQPQPAAIS
jgi:SAM-dependent methyltransferase